MACIKLSNFPSSSSSFLFPIPTFSPFLPYFFHSAQLSPCSPGLFIELSNSGKCFGSSSSPSSFSPAWLSIRCHCHSATLFYRFPRLCCTFFAFSPVELQYKTLGLFYTKCSGQSYYYRVSCCSNLNIRMNLAKISIRMGSPLALFFRRLTVTHNFEYVQATCNHCAPFSFSSH